MNRISDLIFSIDNFVDDKLCTDIYNYLYNKTNKKLPINIDNIMPWFIGNNIFLHDVTDLVLKNKLINIYKEVANILSYLHNEKVYPHFADLVLWKEKQDMKQHVDDGTGEEIFASLHMRKYSAIVYLNDVYEGGQTFIKNGDEVYHSKPKTGSLLMFTSDARSRHGVTKIKKGVRGTFAMWFTTDKNYIDKC